MCACVCERESMCVGGKGRGRGSTFHNGRVNAADARIAKISNFARVVLADAVATTVTHTHALCTERNTSFLCSLKRIVRAAIHVVDALSLRELAPHRRSGEMWLTFICIIQVHLVVLGPFKLVIMLCNQPQV